MQQAAGADHRIGHRRRAELHRQHLRTLGRGSGAGSPSGFRCDGSARRRVYLVDSAGIFGHRASSHRRADGVPVGGSPCGIPDAVTADSFRGHRQAFGFRTVRTCHGLPALPICRICLAGGLDGPRSGRSSSADGGLGSLGWFVLGRRWANIHRADRLVRNDPMGLLTRSPGRTLWKVKRAVPMRTSLGWRRDLDLGR